MAEAASAPSATWIAVLAPDGTLQGFDPTGKADGIAVPVGCDLQPGKYRWNEKFARFDPLPPRSGSSVDLAPDAVKGIARGFMAIRDSGAVKLPEETLAWLDWYAKSLDNQG